MLAEEDVDAVEAQEVRVLERDQASTLALRPEVRTAAVAAVGGVIAGAATVAAVRAVGSVGSRRGSGRRLIRRGRQRDILASRSFLVDVHVLGR